MTVTRSAPVRQAPPPQAPARPRTFWRRAGNAAAGLLLVAAALVVQTFVMSKDERRAPLTSAAGLKEPVRTGRFDAQLEGVQAARSLRIKKTYGDSVETTSQVFLIAKVGATVARTPIQLDGTYLLTADGLRFDQTEKVETALTMSGKFVQPGWWRSSFYYFEVPPSAVAGAHLVVGEKATLIGGEDYKPQADFDPGLDQAAARKLVDSAAPVVEVTG